jgi:hypothetical protein
MKGDMSSARILALEKGDKINVGENDVDSVLLGDEKIQYFHVDVNSFSGDENVMTNLERMGTESVRLLDCRHH